MRVETYHEAKKLDNQIKYATRKGIRYLWFPALDPQGPHQIKDLNTGTQGPVDLHGWLPPS